MKSTALFRLSLSLLAGSLLLLLFSNYGNKKVHPDLNTLMVDAFLKRNNQGDFSQEDFKKYMFYFEKGVTLKGTAIIKDGLFSANDVAAAGWGYNYSEEGPGEMTPKQWITVGGYSADVPEVPASLRHFYDPTRPAGERYLTDITNARIMGSLQKYALTNPKTDGVEWALGKPGDHSSGVQDHQYTWERGKDWMQMAMKETNKGKKDEYMAKAWRSLGETLHMIADNGCPPHVRNDAHPSPLWNNNSWFGNPDPYEELIDVIRTDNPAEFTTFSAGAADPDLKSRFAAMTQVQDIANSLAVFTNANFVTNETISGTDQYGNPKRQTTHPDYPYAAPKLENLNYNANDYSYNSASGIKECIDHYYFAKVIPKMCDPYVDMECVKSQARVLLPNVVEAGSKVMELFIPKLKIEIKSAENGRVTGAITHDTDPEYTSEIKYSGNATLFFKDKKFRKKGEKVMEVKNGQFDISGLDFENGDKVYARIDFGGIGVESQDFLCISGKETDIIYGRYGGECREYINKEAILSLGLKPGNDENTKAANYMKKFENEAYIESYGKSGGENPRPFFIDILPTNLNDNTVDVRNLRYVIKSRSNSYLSSKKDGSNGQIITTYTSNSFKVIIKDKNVITEYNGTFSGDKLSGGYTVTREGKETVKGVFNTRLEAKF